MLHMLAIGIEIIIILLHMTSVLAILFEGMLQLDLLDWPSDILETCVCMIVLPQWEKR